MFFVCPPGTSSRAHEQLALYKGSPLGRVHNTTIENTASFLPFFPSATFIFNVTPTITCGPFLFVTNSHSLQKVMLPSLEKCHPWGLSQKLCVFSWGQAWIHPGFYGPAVSCPGETLPSLQVLQESVPFLSHWAALWTVSQGKHHSVAHRGWPGL